MPKVTEKAYHENKHISVSFMPKAESVFGRVDISMRDREDYYNLPTLYTTHVRHVEDAWLEIDQIFSENTTWSDITQILRKYNVNYHSYCAMD